MVSTRKLWLSSTDIVENILSHPFLKELQEGTLREDSFRFYILQDYLYLKDFGKALLVIASKTDSMKVRDMIMDHVRNSLAEEKQLHTYYVNTWGEDPEKVEKSPVTQAYTDMVVRSAYEDPLPVSLSAVLPCYWIYMVVGRQLQGSPNPLYDRWIKAYSGGAYSRAVQEMIDALEAVEASARDERKALHRFRTASIYEYMFWDCAYKTCKFPFKSGV